MLAIRARLIIAVLSLLTLLAIRALLIIAILPLLSLRTLEISVLILTLRALLIITVLPLLSLRTRLKIAILILTLRTRLALALLTRLILRALGFNVLHCFRCFDTRFALDGFEFCFLLCRRRNVNFLCNRFFLNRRFLYLRFYCFGDRFRLNFFFGRFCSRLLSCFRFFGFSRSFSFLSLCRASGIICCLSLLLSFLLYTQPIFFGFGSRNLDQLGFNAFKRGQMILHAVLQPLHAGNRFG